MQKEQRTYMPWMPTREEYFSFLDGYTVDRVNDLQGPRTRKALLKTFLLETLQNESDFPSWKSSFEEAGLVLDEVDETLFRVRPHNEKSTWGLIELLERRHPVLYTTLDSDEAQKWVRHVVDNSPWLDNVWLSAHIFSELWQHVRQASHPQRFSRLTFEYEARYEVDEGLTQGLEPSDLGEEESDEVDELETGDGIDSQQEVPVERRSSRCTLVERIVEIDAKLKKLQNIYSPFHSITQLRVPATGRGGHDFYFNGRVTNRSDSFADHRQQLAFVLQLYRNTTEAAEHRLWMTLEREEDYATESYSLHGAPVTMRFSSPLSEAVFERWTSLMFSKRSRFRLWGNPILAGKNQIHVYGVDRHLWQPIHMEFTRHHIIAILPKGTCGNIVHRLTTNIQRFLDPAVQVWIGSEQYSSLVNKAMTSPHR